MNFTRPLGTAATIAVMWLTTLSPAHAADSAEAASSKTSTTAQASARFAPNDSATGRIWPLVASGAGVLMFLLRRGPRR